MTAARRRPASLGGVFGSALLDLLGLGISRVSLSADPARQGRVLGAYQAMGSPGRILGPALGGLPFGLLVPPAPHGVAGGQVVACGLAAVALPSQAGAATPKMARP